MLRRSPAYFTCCAAAVHRQGFKCEDTALDDAPPRRYSCETATGEAARGTS